MRRIHAQLDLLRLARGIFQPRLVLVCWVVVVGRIGLDYALQRVFQVDEFQVAQNAVLLARGGEWLAYAPLRLFHLLILAPLLDPSWDTITILSLLRALFFVLFLANLVLIARAQPFFPSEWGRTLVLVGASLIFPLWEHGFEIRSDNVLLFFQLCGMLCVFGTFNACGWRRLTLFFLFGLSAAGMHYATAKGFAIWPAHAGLGFLACLASQKEKSWRRTTVWLVFFAAGLAVGASGVWALNVFSGTFRPQTVSAGLRVGFIRHSLETVRFLPWPLLWQEVLKNPALTVLLVCSLAGLAVDVGRRGWKPSLPALVCLGYFVWSMVFMRANPTPYPYNMVHVAPFAFIVSLGGVAWLWRKNRPLLIALAVIHLASFYRESHVSPFFRHTNFQQTSYIDAAEYLTPPDEPVLDGVGMVTSRPPPARSWWLHSMYMGAYHEGRRDNFAEIMREKMPPVVITNYRWRWLKEEEMDVLRANYVETAPDFHVLGATLREGRKAFRLARPGRYIIRLDDRRNDRLAIDGEPCEDGQFVRLTGGDHEIELQGGAQVLWVNEGTEHFPPLIVPTQARLFVKP